MNDAPKQFRLVQQVNPTNDTRCARCGRTIYRGGLYFRRALDLDGADPLGADFCAGCKPMATAAPEPIHA